MSRVALGVGIALGLALPLLRPMPAAAQGAWQPIGTTNVGNPVSLQTKSVKRAGGITTATLRVRFAKPVASPQGPVTSSRTVVMFDCAKRMVAIRENVYYHDEQANKVWQRKTVAIPGYAAPFEGSMPAVGMAHLCKK